jgi:hypothetical protein
MSKQISNFTNVQELMGLQEILILVADLTIYLNLFLWDCPLRGMRKEVILIRQILVDETFMFVFA